jgi:hypothetical protein
MSDCRFTIRRLGSSDADAFRLIRLEGLRNDPEAFGSTFEKESSESVQLTVVVSNPRARRFYQRMGFVEYGLEEKSLKYKGAYFDEVLMVKFLSRKE